MNQEITESDNIQEIRAEIRIIQARLAHQKTPWYLNALTWISLLALLLSFGTAYFAYSRARDQDNRTKTQDIHNDRVELRGLVQRLVALPREFYETNAKYSQNREVLAALQEQSMGEATLLSAQALELAKSLPPKTVSAAEWYSIAQGLRSTYGYEGAKECLDYAMASAHSFNEKITVRRAYADLLFSLDDANAGREEYKKALSIFAEFKGYDDYTRNVTHTQTNMNWAYSELNSGNRQEAAERLKEAEKWYSKLSPTRNNEMLRAQLDDAQNQVGSKEAPEPSQPLPVLPPKPTVFHSSPKLPSKANKEKHPSSGRTKTKPRKRVSKRPVSRRHR